MKTRSWLSPITSKVLRVCLTILMVAFWTACSDDTANFGPGDDASAAPLPEWASTPQSFGGVTPYLIPNGARDTDYFPGYINTSEGTGWNGGNRTCEQVAYVYETSFTNSSARVNAEDFTNGQYTFGPITVTTTDGIHVSWSSSVPVKAVFILKGSNAANTYYYSSCSTEDSGLASPETYNRNGKLIPHDLSNLTVCWTVCDDNVCYDHETAWAATSAGNNRYATKGNWATSVSYGGIEKTVNLYAGQTMLAGTVNLKPELGQVRVTITLAVDWSFALVNESVKIQGYALKPGGNPAPGLFANKFNAAGTSWTGTVPVSAWYGIHNDLRKKVVCTN